MRFTDGKREAEIRLFGENGIEWTKDFFNAGQFEGQDEPYQVDDVQDCIDAATDLIYHRGDYVDITDDETTLYVKVELAVIRDADYTHSIDSYKELEEWVEKRKSDKKAHYYYGFLKNFEGQLYTIKDIEDDMEEWWFDEDAETPVIIYEWEV